MEIELIPDQNDQWLLDTPIHWEGDFVHIIEHCHVGAAALQFILPTGGEEKTATLSYPHIKAIPGKYHTLYITFGKPEPPYADRNFSWLFTDGNYSYGEDDAHPESACTHSIVAIEENLPGDWNKENTQLIITAYNTGDEDAELLANGFMLVGIGGRPQYLPVMGIG